MEKRFIKIFLTFEHFSPYQEVNNNIKHKF